MFTQPGDGQRSRQPDQTYPNENWHVRLKGREMSKSRRKGRKGVIEVPCQPRQHSLANQSEMLRKTTTSPRTMERNEQRFDKVSHPEDNRSIR